jgi:hypothetical protein
MIANAIVQPERVDESARVAGHERDRQEDHHQRQRGRHHRQSNLTGALDRRFERRHMLLFYVAEDVLEHDDRVVDDDADGKRQAEQRHVVQREVHAAHQGERGDDGRRDGQRRDDHRAQVRMKNITTTAARREPQMRCSSSDEIDA